MVTRATFPSLVCAAVLLAEPALLPDPVPAQDPETDPGEEQVQEGEFPIIGGGEVRLGPAFPSVAEQGWSLGADLDLGSVFMQALRAFAGYTGLLGVDVDRSLRGDVLQGDLRAHGLRAGVRWDLLRERQFVPYLSGAVVALRSSAGALQPEDEEAMEDIYGGNRLGWSVAAGLVYPLETTEQMVALAEARRSSVGPLRHWSLDVGVRVELREHR